MCHRVGVVEAAADAAIAITVVRTGGAAETRAVDTIVVVTGVFRAIVAVVRVTAIATSANARVGSAIVNVKSAESCPRRTSSSPRATPSYCTLDSNASCFARHSFNCST